MVKMKDLKSGQKFIGRNRVPRVQIEYDVEIYGSQEKVEIPFVMGVMSDLSGDANSELLEVSERKFEEFNQTNFDDNLSKIRPRLNYFVEDTLSKDGTVVEVDLDFSKMEDFDPANIAKKVPALKKLLEARQELSQLTAYMDGKTDAEDLIEAILKNDEWLDRLSKEAHETESQAQSAGKN